MRFKKLRISVGIALIIFIFVVGNIILFGQLTKDKSLVKDLSDQNFITITENQNPPSQKMKTITNNENINQINEPVLKNDSPAEPVIIHTKIKTRAS